MRPGSGTTTRDLHVFMDRTMRLALTVVGGALQEHRLSMPQLAALSVLRDRGTGSIGELGDQLNLTLAGTSHLVDRLVGRGLIDRVEDPDDRRQRRLAITASGRAVIEQVDRRVADAVEQALAALPPDVRAAFDRALRGVVDAWEERP